MKLPLPHSVHLRLALWTTGVMALLLLLFAVLFYERLATVLSATQDGLLFNRAVAIASGFTPGRGLIPPPPDVRAGDDPRERRWRDRDDDDSPSWRDRRRAERDNDGERGRDRRWRGPRRPDEPLIRILERGRQHHGDYCIVITDSAGSVVECSRHMTYAVAAFPAHPVQAQFFTAADTAGIVSRFVAYPLQTPEGPHTLYIGQARDRVEEPLQRIRLFLAVVVPCGILLLALGSYFIAARGLRPLRRLAHDAAGMDGHDPTARLTVPARRDEVAELAGAFNGLLTRIAAATARQRQFTADAAHELRTPLAGLKNRLQVARRRERSAGEYRDLLAALETDARHVETLLDGLLLLARLDHARELPVAPVPLRTLLDTLAAGPHATGLRLTLTVPDAVSVRGSETLLRQLFSNLLDNARKYAGASAHVSITAAMAGDRVIVTVADNGPGVPPDVLPQIFDRFYKADSARSERGSAGLGLAIVAAIAAAHGGSVAAAAGSPRGLRFTISLPAA